LDSVKDRVDVPWKATSLPAVKTEVEVSTEISESSTLLKQVSISPVPEKAAGAIKYFRILHGRNFTKALKEITPSSSESHGTLADLRKWNEEFGEGQRDRKRRQAWGKGRFGFIDKLVKVEEGKVALGDYPS
jgi:hypothetical protein